MRKRKTDYEYWKDGEKIPKMPWVIKHYNSITDINQYRMGKRAYNINLSIVTIVCILSGLWIGNIIWG